ncbi:MAG: VOC family protein [Anaerolineales bacterium]|nr:VOC family protein [Anaerolineales bacterium]
MITRQPKSGITFLKTRNLSETTRFYSEIMGFDLVLDQQVCRIFKACPNCYIGFCQTEGSTGSEEVIFTLEMDDVDGFCAYLLAQGIEIDIWPRLNERYNIYQMFVRDPNGYRIEIQRFLDPGWAQAR